MRAPTTSEEAGVLIITLDDPGAVNDGRSEAFRGAVYELVKGRPGVRVAVDLTPIDYLSSSGVALLIGLKRRVAAEGGRLVLFGLQPYVRDVIDLMRLAPLLPTAPDRPAALAALEAPPSS